jgi:hypothetical protein
MKHYSEAAVERMIKVQEVILRSIAGKLRWWEAAEILGVSDRTRWRGGATSSMATMDSMIGGRASRVPSGCHWRRWRRCYGFTDRSMRITTCGIFISSQSKSTGSSSATAG